MSEQIFECPYERWKADVERVRLRNQSIDCSAADSLQTPVVSDDMDAEELVRVIKGISWVLGCVLLLCVIVTLILVLHRSSREPMYNDKVVFVKGFYSGKEGRITYEGYLGRSYAKRYRVRLTDGTETAEVASIDFEVIKNELPDK